MNKITNMNKASVKQLQSSFFLKNLRKEMDKMSVDCKKDEMIKAAHEYISLGISKKETEELLKLDGYDPIMAQAFMNRDDFVEEFSEDKKQQWGFDIEDSHGRVFSSSDFNIKISANNEQEAFENAEKEIEKFSSIQIDRVVGVYKI